MFYSPTTSIFRTFYQINDIKEIQNGGSKMAAIFLLKTTNFVKFNFFKDFLKLLWDLRFNSKPSTFFQVAKVERFTPLYRKLILHEADGSQIN